MSGRHRKPNRGLPPLISGAGIAAVLVATVVLARPADIPDQPQPLPFPAPVLQLTPPAPAPDTTMPPAERTGPSTTRASPSPTTTAPPPDPEPPAPAKPDPATACSTATLDGTRGHVAAAGRHLAARFGVPLGSILGVGPRAIPGSDHPRGYALDFMVNRATGDALADYVLAHRAELAVKYVIWRQRINYGRGWTIMGDRGSATANHLNHVHVSFNNSPPATPITC